MDYFGAVALASDKNSRVKILYLYCTRDGLAHPVSFWPPPGDASPNLRLPFFSGKMKNPWV
jgi:hypothetical protein